MQPESTPPPSPSGAVPPPRPFPADGAAFVAALQSLGSEAHAIRPAQGWETFYAADFAGPDRNKIPSGVAGLHSTLSGALEGWKVGDRQRFADELARLQLGLAELAYGLGVNLGAETLRKLQGYSPRGR